MASGSVQTVQVHTSIRAHGATTLRAGGMRMKPAGIQSLSGRRSIAHGTILKVTDTWQQASMWTATM